MKNKKVKQRQLDRDAGDLARSVVFAVVFPLLIMSMASPIFNHYDPSGTAFWVGLDLVEIGGAVWAMRKIAKFNAARAAEKSE